MVTIEHALIRIKTQNANNLSNEEAVHKLIESISSVLNTTIIDFSAHTFEPSGFTAFALLQESHIAIHSWPEENYCVLDVLSCKKFVPDFQTSVEMLLKTTFSISEILFDK